MFKTVPPVSKSEIAFWVGAPAQNAISILDIFAAFASLCGVMNRISSSETFQSSFIIIRDQLLIGTSVNHVPLMIRVSKMDINGTVNLITYRPI